MNKNDYIIEQIESVINRCADKAPRTELGYFESCEDRAFRKEAVNEMFCALNRDNQNKALKYLTTIMQTQYS